MNMRKDSEYKEKHKQWCKDHYKANKQKYLDRNAERVTEFRAIVSQAKGTYCSDCKRHYHPCQLDFDHVQGVKKFNITSGKSATSKTSLLAEIEKCEVVCASCHRLRTYNRGSSNLAGLRPLKA